MRPRSTACSRKGPKTHRPGGLKGGREASSQLVNGRRPGRRTVPPGPCIAKAGGGHGGARRSCRFSARLGSTCRACAAPSFRPLRRYVPCGKLRGDCTTQKPRAGLVSGRDNRRGAPTATWARPRACLAHPRPKYTLDSGNTQSVARRVVLRGARGRSSAVVQDRDRSPLSPSRDECKVVRSVRGRVLLSAHTQASSARMERASYILKGRASFL